MKRSKSSQKWLNKHFEDPYVKKSWQDGYRSRAVYKLLEINDKDKLFKPGMTVVDLGAAPGGWSQVIAPMVGKKGKVVAMDILDIEPLDDVTFIQGDFREQEVFDQLLDVLNGERVDIVISDMAPNLSGMKSVDQPNSIYLCELALDFAENVLKPGGDLLVKIFQGDGFDAYLTAVRKLFKKVIIRKPDASSKQSREVYMLAREFK